MNKEKSETLKFADGQSVSHDLVLEAVTHEWMVEHYRNTCNGIKSINVSVVKRVDQPIIRVNLKHGNGGTIKLFYFIRRQGGKIVLTMTDDSNVKRCSTNKRVSSTVQHWS